MRCILSCLEKLKSSCSGKHLNVVKNSLVLPDTKAAKLRVKLDPVHDWTYSGSFEYTSYSGNIEIGQPLYLSDNYHIRWAKKASVDLPIVYQQVLLWLSKHQTKPTGADDQLLAATESVMMSL